MTIYMTMVTAKIRQLTALSVSGLDRQSPSDSPFTVVNGKPILLGSGLRGAAVSMARRFFDPLPRAISEERDRRSAFRRSAWEFSNAHLDPDQSPISTRLRAGVGIMQKTGARADGVLYDYEVTPAGTMWQFNVRANHRYLQANESPLVQNILAYVLQEHWAQERCWLGGNIARGLGWNTLDDLKCYQFTDEQYAAWIAGGRKDKDRPSPIEHPTAIPTRSWCFSSRRIYIHFGPYMPESSSDGEGPWGLDMVAVGPHHSERSDQVTNVSSSAASAIRGSAPVTEASSPPMFTTDRSQLLEKGNPLVPGASIRGPMRHALSQRARAQNTLVNDPHEYQAPVPDVVSKIFGSVYHSSQVLIKDAQAVGDWYGARLHMHAEDEFSGGSFESAKRDVVRILQAQFPVDIVVEGSTPTDVQAITQSLDWAIQLGGLGHLPIGADKTRGAGWGIWRAEEDWQHLYIEGSPAAALPKACSDIAHSEPSKASGSATPLPNTSKDTSRVHDCHLGIYNRTIDDMGSNTPKLGQALNMARKEYEDRTESSCAPTFWWCDPTIDFSRTTAPETFGESLPADDTLKIDEVMFFWPTATWHGAKTRNGWRVTFIREIPSDHSENAKRALCISTMVRLHGNSRYAFQAHPMEPGNLELRTWWVAEQPIGYTLRKLPDE